VHIAGSGLDLDNKLRIGVLHLMGLIAIERLFLALAAKTGVRVRGVPVDIMVVIAAPLKKNHFEHQHRVPGGSPPIGIEALAVLLDKAKIHHLGQVLQKAGALGQNLLIEKIAEEGTVGFALFGQGRPNNYTILQYVRWPDN
jgi:hypothetical protein